MKISYVTMQWPAASETFAARDVLALSNMGHDIEVLAMRPDNRDIIDLSNSLGIDNIQCQRMRIVDQLHGIFNLIKHFSKSIYLTKLLFQKEHNLSHLIKSLLLFPATFKIFDRLNKTKPDVVHLFWGHYPSLIGLLVFRYLPSIQLTQFLGPYDLQYNYALSSVVGGQASAIFTHVEQNREALVAIGIDESKMHIVHRGINTTGTVLAQPTKHGSIIFIGRLIKTKGIFEMLDVMEILLQSHPTAHLTVIGDGEDRLDFEDHIKSKSLENNITLTGWLTPSEIQSYLLKSSIMLFLSYSERLPNAVKEAMVYGVVPVSSNTIGIEELISDGTDGYIVNDIRNSEEISEKLASLINNKNLHGSMARHARQKILSHFNVIKAMEKYTAIWSNNKIN